MTRDDLVGVMQLDGVYCMCPYCNAGYQVESEDFSDAARVEQCGECGKSYRTWQEFSVTTYAEPDCSLNGQKHDESGIAGSCARCGRFM